MNLQYWSVGTNSEVRLTRGKKSISYFGIMDDEFTESPSPSHHSSETF